jgi:predicted kinase
VSEAPTLTVTRGLPGSGKTTWALKQLAGRAGPLVRVNRDEIRAMLHGGQPWSQALEKVTLVARNALIRALLQHGASVICDDTNLDQATVDRLEAVAWLATGGGCNFHVEDLRHVPVDVCVERDRRRGEDGGRSVGEQVIRKMADTHRLPTHADQQAK